MEKYEIIKFQNGSIELDVEVSPLEETVWLSKEQMALLFDRDRSVISRHIKNIFEERELEEKSNVHFLHIANSDKPVLFYSLDVIISVGYRVKSNNGIVFRKWATNVLKQYLLKGYTISPSRTLVTNENYINLIHEVNSLKNDVEEIKNLVKEKVIKPFVCYEGEYYDGFVFINNLICSAKRRVIVVDGYADDSLLEFFINSKKDTKKFVVCHKSKRINDATIERFIKQYGEIRIIENKNVHDRFLIIDDEIYMIGSSLNSVGNKTSVVIKVHDISLKDIFKTSLDI